jgi:hypothetical protein
VTRFLKVFSPCGAGEEYGVFAKLELADSKVTKWVLTSLTLLSIYLYTQATVADGECLGVLRERQA